MAKFGMKWKKNISIGRVVGKLVATLIALYVGGTVINSIGTSMNGTTSPMYGGLQLIGWTVTNNKIESTSGSTASVLTVIGLIGIASIILEFVQFRLK